MISSRFIREYLLLVGLPLAGVIAVLQTGARLSPPLSVAGEWLLEADLEANAETPCARQLSGFARPEFSISQSGVYLEIALPNANRDRLAGRLEGVRLVAEAHPDLFGDNVFGLLRITGALDTTGRESVIRGVLAMPRMIECIPAPFRAVRKSAGSPVPRLMEN